MIFKKLIINNFGIYRGNHEFDLTPRISDNEEDFAPIVLFGGKNGAGKTTILEAIRLCIYGRLALGDRVREIDYEDYIYQRLNRDIKTDELSTDAHIGLIFEHTHAGVKNIYDAQRRWIRNDEQLDEQISILKNGMTLSEIDQINWNDFLRDMIPAGVSNLFFFDGEKIQALADDKRESATLTDSIERLLNLDLVQRLKTDLTVYLRQQSSSSNDELEQVVSDAEDNLELMERDLYDSKQDLAQIRSKLDRVENQLKLARTKLMQEGATFVQQKEANQERQKYVEHEIARLESSVHSLASNLLPFAIIPDLCLELADRLYLEEEVQNALITQHIQLAKAEEVQTLLQNEEFQSEFVSDMSLNDWQKLTQILKDILEPQDALVDVEIRHSVSAGERRSILSWIDIALNDIPIRLDTLTSELNQYEEELVQLKRAINQAPDEGIANPYIEEFNSWAEEKGFLLKSAENAQENIEIAEKDVIQAKKELEIAREQLDKAEDIDLRIHRANKAQIVLDQYLEAIKAIKLQELEKEIVKYFNRLCRKRLLIKEAHIDPKDYEITLYGENRIIIHKSDLSAGEKQLYAMSILWALRSVSGRSLPIIIDTPMGRLDSDHRKSLLNHFFPFASHQTILLSTDTEIDRNAYTALEPYISHTFHLEFDDRSGETIVTQGYFSDLAKEDVSL